VECLEEWEEWDLQVQERSRTSNKTEVSIGPSKLTRFERARIVGARALQIAMGAPILVGTPETHAGPIDIALLELDTKILPLTVRRTLPDGTYQDIPIKWLLG
jgi:DNA-directed RNA polymerase I, II, and III subunit RPABC2